MSEVIPLIESGDSKGVLAFFQDMPEKERRAQFKLLEPTARKYLDSWFNSDAWRASTRAAGVAAWATCSRSETERLRLFHLDDEDFDALENRRPPWLQEWVEALLERQPDYRAFMLIQRDLVGPIDHENYHIGWITWMEPRRDDLAQVLRERREFLADGLWRFFEFEGLSDCNLAGYDKYSSAARQWAPALVTLSREGLVPRDRLLDASLAALLRDFMQFRAGWFSRFHELLEPTVEERVARLDRYFDLLGSSIGPTVTFALKSLLVIDKAVGLDTDELLARIPPVLLAKSMATIKLAFRLLKSARKRAPDRDAEIAETFAQALLHESADVQSLVVDELEKLDPTEHEAIRDTVRAALDGVAPSLRPRLQPWCDGDEAAVADADIPSTSRPTEPVAPIADGEEFLLEFARVLEDPTDPIGVERVLDGFAHFFTADLDTRALLKRAQTISKSSSERQTLQYRLVELILAWHEERDPRWNRKWDRYTSTDHLLQDRITELFHIARAGQRPLATPTDSRGCIDPDVLVERSKAAHDTGLADQVSALLRLHRDGREAALAKAADIPDEFGAALRHALGSPDERVGLNADLWIAAARARDPLADDERVAARHPNLGPGGALAARCRFDTITEYSKPDLVLHRTDAITITPASTRPTVLFHVRGEDSFSFCHRAGSDTSSVRWTGTIAPNCTEDYFAAAIERVDPDWWEARWEVRNFLEPMLFAETRLGPNAYRLLALGLAAKEPGQSGMAVDCALAAIGDGRMDTHALGSAMAELLSLPDQVKPPRWAKSLAEVARVSTQAARACRDAIEVALTADPAKMPKAIGKLLEFFYELCVQLDARVTDPKARTYLEAITTGGKTGQVKKKLLAL